MSREFDDYLNELAVFGIFWAQTSETERSIIKEYFQEKLSAKLCAKHLAFPW